MMDLGKHLESLAIGGPRVHKNLSVRPLFARESPLPGPGSLSAALLRGDCHASPLQAPGRLPAWLVRNAGDAPLFAAAGEVLSANGTRRVLNHSVLVAPGTCLELPGTWLGKPGMEHAAEYLASCRWAPGQVGSVFCVDGVVRAIEWFGDPRLCRHAGSGSLLRFARAAAESRAPATLVPADAVVAGWIRRIMAIRVDAVPTLGDGQSFRPVSGRLVGQCLAARGRLIHARFSEACRVRSADVRGLGRRPGMGRGVSRSVRQVTLADPWAG
jgi:hypothetical protein